MVTQSFYFNLNVENKLNFQCNHYQQKIDSTVIIEPNDKSFKLRRGL